MIPTLLAAGDPLDHVVDHVYPAYNYELGGMTLNMLSNHIIMMMVAGVLLVLFMPIWVRPKNTGDEVTDLTPTGARNGLEVICQMLREFVARPNFGEHTDRFIPYIWSVFFFILTVNLLGLLPLDAVTKKIFGTPIYGTATGNVWVTAALACCTLFMLVVNGLRINGMVFVKHFFMGPFPISVMIAGLEVIGLFAKTFALAIRLFANMMAGHILLAVLLGFIAAAGPITTALGAGVTFAVVLGSVAINMLELFVAFLQAFIFTFLTCVFVGQAVNLHHDDHHEEHEHAHAH